MKTPTNPNTSDLDRKVVELFDRMDAIDPIIIWIISSSFCVLSSINLPAPIQHIHLRAIVNFAVSNGIKEDVFLSFYSEYSNLIEERITLLYKTPANQTEI